MGELLTRLIDAETIALAKHSVRHAPTIGAMYEGLTARVLELALPAKPGLQIVSGFARGVDGNLSKQLDCMVVIGSGENVSYTNTWIYPLSDIVAVVEVKKSLVGGSVSDGHENLASVSSLRSCVPHPRVNAARNMFQQMTRLSWPDSDEGLSAKLQLYRSLAQLETALPLRILLGYQGLRTDSGLRKAVEASLKGRLRRRGFGPLSLPSMIANDQVSLVKMNGVPWSSTISADGWWPVLVRPHISPAEALVEMLWSRLNSLGIVGAEVFGDDRMLTCMEPYLEARFDEGENGWDIKTQLAPRKRATNPLASALAWQPTVLTLSQHVLLTFMCKGDELDLNALPLGWPTQAEVLQDLQLLRAAGLAGPSPTEPHKWSLLTEQLQLVIDPELGFAGGENSTGRVERWLFERIGKRASALSPR